MVGDKKIYTRGHGIYSWLRAGGGGTWRMVTPAASHRARYSVSQPSHSGGVANAGAMLKYDAWMMELKSVRDKQK